MTQNYHETGVEPTVEELMADPIMHLILKSDRIAAADTWEAIEITRRRLAVLRWRHAATKTIPPSRNRL